MNLIGRMRFLLVIAFLPLASCEPAPIHLAIREAGPTLVAEAYKTWWFGLRSSEVPCVHDVTLVRQSDGKTLWKMTVAPERQCNHVRAFTIGEAPAGFRDETKLASKLTPGDYMLNAWGIGEGTQHFTLPLG